MCLAKGVSTSPPPPPPSSNPYSLRLPLRAWGHLGALIKALREDARGGELGLEVGEGNLGAVRPPRLVRLQPSFGAASFGIPCHISPAPLPHPHFMPPPFPPLPAAPFRESFGHFICGPEPSPGLGWEWRGLPHLLDSQGILQGTFLLVFQVLVKSSQLCRLLECRKLHLWLSKRLDQPQIRWTSI